MRVATVTIYNSGTIGMSNLQSMQTRLQNQLSSGRKLLSPSDDPIASSRALKVTETNALVTQYSTNSTSADSALRVSESTMNQLTTLIQNVQQLAINAGNPTQIATDKAALENELQGRYQELLALANQTDGNGLYLFSGYQGNTKPFTETAFGQVTYNGDDGQRLIQISSSRNLPVSEPGSDVFQRVKNGNGTFVTAYNPTNTGSGIVSPGEVVDPTKWKTAAGNVQDYKIEFNVTVDPADSTKTITHYDIIDNRATLPGTATPNPNFNFSMIDSYDYSGGPRPVVAGVNSYPRNYVPGGDIQFKQLAGETTPRIANWDFGVKTSVSGTPKTGDQFTLQASQNVDMFSTFAAFSSALKNYNTDTTGNGQADFQNQLNTVVSNLANALSNVLTRQSYQGSRMNEIDSVKATNDDLNLQYSKTLSGLQDLDYTKAISDFSQNQTLLQAAQQSFAAVQGLSLFKYI
ncbi:Flagellar hook-associated protein 3 [Andreprevotia sp. IGB-42]|uniref:flagellar hook-associated protein FlgL n=1 Tax=Andreprevotia sp. IGB-42 TaxID=2497473 RepID=UPI001359C034|nr:flagellar hook-associated protein FlgL [Andreprevotia sp. IGB-42]KAF0812525.1 Flagellar hook-associated protein 3 [Andreprevotia sp. IGB-42]